MTLVRQICRIAGPLLARPDLWGAAMGIGVRCVPDRWWRHGVVGVREYLDFRGSAVYGMPLARIPAGEFIRYLEWCKAFPGPVR